MSNKMARNERKVQILQALHECLLEKPFHLTSIKDIAKKAGVNHGLLHYYFESKEDILLNYIDYMFDKSSVQYSEENIRKLKETADTAESFAAIYNRMLKEISFNPELARIYTEIWALAIYNPKVMKKLKNQYRKWKDRLHSLIENFVSDKKTAARMSLTLVAIAEGMSLFSIFFRRNELCTDINFPEMLQSMAPEIDSKFE